MKIEAKSIRTIGRIQLAAKGETKVKFAVKIVDIDHEILKKVGFTHNPRPGDCIIPSMIGNITTFNANGKDIPQKHLKKEKVYHDVYRTWRDWHGQEHSGFATQEYKKYPVKHINSPAELLYCDLFDGIILITSREIDLAKENESNVIHIANMMLECFGYFEIVDPNTGIKAGIPLNRLQWEILPAGKYPWEKAKISLEKFSATLPSSQREVITHRIQKISKFVPDFIATGTGGFRGYFVYGFSKKKIFIMESYYLGNATYVFGDDWLNISMLTKNDIIQGKLSIARIIHDRAWERKINELLR